jgi:subtilisin family serine protease
MVLSADPFQAIFSLDGVSNTTTLAYRAGSDPWRVKGLPIVPLTLNATVENDACSTLPTTADLSNVISLVRRGGCTFEQKQNNLKKAGAQNILFYNNDSPLIAPSSPASNPIIGMIEKKAGEAIIATVKAGGSVTVDFTLYADYKVGAYNSAGGIPSEFTSWGGSFDLDVKPDIGAPGRSILAPYLEKSYAALSGTSMSCPYVAGVVALYISKFGGRDVHGPGFAKKLANRIISSGNSVPWQVQQPTSLPINYGFWAPVMQVGNGAINAQTILNAQTSLDFEKFALNDTGHFSRYQKVHITNEGKEPVTYSFALQPAGTFDAQSENPSYLASFLELVPYEFVPKVSFPSGKFSVQPGETKTAQ